MPEGFTETLREACEPDWSHAVGHRFVKELFAGAMPDAVMARYLIQDHRFLDSFLILLGAALVSADTFAARLRFGRFVGAVSSEENTYFLRSFEALGVTEDRRAADPDTQSTTGFKAIMREAADSDKAGRVFRFESGHPFRFQSGHQSDRNGGQGGVTQRVIGLMSRVRSWVKPDCMVHRRSCRHEPDQSRPKPRGGSMPASSSRSRSTIACNASPVAPSCSASGSASSHAAYSDCSLSNVATAACHCCGRLARQIGRGGRRVGAARLSAWRWR